MSLVLQNQVDVHRRQLKRVSLHARLQWMFSSFVSITEFVANFLVQLVHSVAAEAFHSSRAETGQRLQVQQPVFAGWFFCRFCCGFASCCGFSCYIRLFSTSRCSG